MDRVYVMQLVRSHQVGELSRRDFLARAGVALGSVAAANTLLAACTPATTDAPPVVLDPTAGPDVKLTETATPDQQAIGLSGSMVEYPARSGETLSGYLSAPVGTPKGPPILVIQEWWGLNDHIKDVTDRFANEGFLALAPDLYHGQVVSEPDEARKLVMELDMPTAVAEIGAAADFLASHSASNGSGVAIVGFCMGGRLALQTVLVEEGLATVVPFYGTPLEPDQAIEVKAPLLGIYGEKDGGIPFAEVRAMEEALTAAGIENEFHIYPGAGHAFFNDQRESYNGEASADAWRRTLDWLSEQQGA